MEVTYVPKAPGKVSLQFIGLADSAGNHEKQYLLSHKGKNQTITGTRCCKVTRAPRREDREKEAPSR